MTFATFGCISFTPFLMLCKALLGIHVQQSDDVNWESYVNTKQRKMVKDCFHADIRTDDKNVCNTGRLFHFRVITE